MNNKMMILVLGILSCISLNAYTREISTREDTRALVDVVKKSLSYLEKQVAKELNIKFVDLEAESLECLGLNSSFRDLTPLGTCLISGTLDYPNSDTVFQITRSEDPVQEDASPSFTISVITGEI